MSISPLDHYGLYEAVPITIGEVSEFIRGVDEAAESFDCDVYWRGQTDHRWGVTSSLSRLSDTPTVSTDADLRNAELQLIKEAKRWVTSLIVTPTSELEWLALLQHMGVPTRLIDFTPNPLIATFFASESQDDVEGRLFAILVPRSNLPLTEEAAKRFEINSLRQGDVKLWKPPIALSPRVAVQRGVFALSKLPSTSPRRLVQDDEAPKGWRPMLRSEVVSVMSVPLAITSLDTRSMPYTNGIRCYTARIHVDKAAIREQLAKRAKKGSLRPVGSAIDHSYCYPDVEGMMQYSQVLARLKRGI